MKHEMDSCRVQEDRFYRRPLVDIAETDKGYLITADLPGAERKDLEISVEQNLLTLRSPAPAEEEVDQRSRREFYLPGYKRQFRLPEEADLDQISANLKDGVLAISIPRRPEKEPRRIEIKD